MLYRGMDYLKHQFFIHTDWPGGIFASPALLGTRPGGSIAAAWAALHYFGMEGYLEQARVTLKTSKKLMEGVNDIPGLEVIGAPMLSVFAYQSTDRDVNIYAVADCMEARGWHVDRQQRPECMHAMVTASHHHIADRFLADLHDAVGEVRQSPDLADKGAAAMYGMIAKLPLRGMVRQNVLKMMEAMYSAEGIMPDLDGAGDEDPMVKLGLKMMKLWRDVSHTATDAIHDLKRRIGL